MSGNSASEESAAGADSCWVECDLNGRILQADGSLKSFFNLSHRSIAARDIYTFIEGERERLRLSSLALAANVTIERDLWMRPRERKRVRVRAVITRQPDGASFRWHFRRI